MMMRPTAEALLAPLPRAEGPSPATVFLTLKLKQLYNFLKAVGDENQLGWKLVSSKLKLQPFITFTLLRANTPHGVRSVVSEPLH